jgi:uncharacterized protein (TIGR02598 family)
MRPWRRGTAAFSLVELTLALGVAAFCLMAIFGLMPVGVQTNRNATSQTAAASIIRGVAADLRATPKTVSTSTQFTITFGTCKNLYFDSQGQVVASSDCVTNITLPATARYKLNITWAGSAALRYADIKVTWPAAATVANASGTVEIFAAFDRN